MWIEPETTVVAADDVFTLEVFIANVDDLGGFEFNLTYDPVVVWVTEVQVGEFLGSTNRSVVTLGPEIDNDTGEMAFGGFTFGEPGGPEGSGRLATLICQARSAGMSAATFSDVQIVNTQATLLTPLTTLDGSVTVQAP
ncbi:MAG: cohesin domain-containing protein [Planctomycetota bacterium]|jgi:hypothetical protein